jgi:hypothetical protein
MSLSTLLNQAEGSPVKRKYEFTGEVTRVGTMHDYTELYRIRRLSDG